MNEYEEENFFNECDSCGTSLRGTNKKYCTSCFWEEENQSINLKNEELNTENQNLKEDIEKLNEFIKHNIKV